MIKEFTQKQRQNTRKYFLFQDRIKIEIRSISKVDKYEIHFDKIGTEILYYAENTLPRTIFVLILSLIPIATLIVKYFIPDSMVIGTVYLTFGICLFMGLIIGFKKSADYVYIKGNENLTFYRKYPSEQAVLEFIDLIVKTSNKYFKDRYFKFDKFIPEDEFYNNIKWLLTKEIISNEEFEKIIVEYKTNKLIN